MRIRSARVIVAAVAALALVGAGTSTAQAAESSGSSSKGSTRVVVAPEVFKLITGAGIKPAAIKPATAKPAGTTLAAKFPISSIKVSKLQVRHTGGIKLSAGDAKISLRNFTIDVNKLRVYGKVNGGDKSVPLFTISRTDRAHYGPLKLSLTSSAATALNTTFKVDAFAEGATFGYAKVSPKG